MFGFGSLHVEVAVEDAEVVVDVDVVLRLVVLDVMLVEVVLRLVVLDVVVVDVEVVLARLEVLEEVLVVVERIDDGEDVGMAGDDEVESHLAADNTDLLGCASGLADNFDCTFASGRVGRLTSVDRLVDDAEATRAEDLVEFVVTADGAAHEVRERSGSGRHR